MSNTITGYALCIPHLEYEDTRYYASGGYETVRIFLDGDQATEKLKELRLEWLGQNNDFLDSIHINEAAFQLAVSFLVQNNPENYDWDYEWFEETLSELLDDTPYNLEVFTDEILLDIFNEAGVVPFITTIPVEILPPPKRGWAICLPCFIDDSWYAGYTGGGYSVSEVVLNKELAEELLEKERKEWVEFHRVVHPGYLFEVLLDLKGIKYLEGLLGLEEDEDYLKSKDDRDEERTTIDDLLDPTSYTRKDITDEALLELLDLYRLAPYIEEVTIH